MPKLRVAFPCKIPAFLPTSLLPNLLLNRYRNRNRKSFTRQTTNHFACYLAEICAKISDGAFQIVALKESNLLMVGFSETCQVA